MNNFWKSFDVQHPLFKPLWLRVLIIVFTFCWATFEYLNGNGLWALLFAACGAYLAHQWLWAWNPPKDDEE